MSGERKIKPGVTWLSEYKWTDADLEKNQARAFWRGVAATLFTFGMFAVLISLFASVVGIADIHVVLVEDPAERTEQAEQAEERHLSFGDNSL